MPHLSVRKLCRSLGVSRQWYYQRRCPSAHQEDDQRLRAAIQEIREVEAFSGYRRVTKALARAGRIGQPQMGLACHAASWLDQASASDAPCIQPIRSTTDLGLPASGQGTAGRGTPIGLRVSDLRYVRLPEGFVYLACMLDGYSRTCIGWSLSRRIDAQLPRRGAGDGISRTRLSLPG